MPLSESQIFTGDTDDGDFSLNFHIVVRITDYRGLRRFRGLLTLVLASCIFILANIGFLTRP